MKNSYYFHELCWLISYQSQVILIYLASQFAQVHKNWLFEEVSLIIVKGKSKSYNCTNNRNEEQHFLLPVNHTTLVSVKHWDPLPPLPDTMREWLHFSFGDEALACIKRVRKCPIVHGTWLMFWWTGNEIWRHNSGEEKKGQYRPAEVIQKRKMDKCIIYF